MSPSLLFLPYIDGSIAVGHTRFVSIVILVVGLPLAPHFHGSLIGQKLPEYLADLSWDTANPEH